MSLKKQLWLAIVLVIFICLTGSFMITTLSATRYLETQLYQKNIDSANNIALSLNTGSFSPSFAETQITSQFDNGFFQRITLSAPNGGVIYEKNDDRLSLRVPSWFQKLVTITPAPGIANVSNGWLQVGKLEVVSSSAFAYEELWSNTLRLSGYFLLTALLSGLLGHIVLHRLIKPLAAVVNQAKAIGERKFVTIAEPSTLEFRNVVSSMNQLSSRVKDMLAQEATRLTTQQKEGSRDENTKLLAREALLSAFKGTLQRDDHTASGGVILCRLNDLQNLNKLYDRSTLDNLILATAELLHNLAATVNGGFSGRLDGSGFIIVLPEINDINNFTSSTHKKLLALLEERHLPDDVFYLCSRDYMAREDAQIIIDQLEKCVDDMVANGTSNLCHVAASNSQLPNEAASWQKIFDEAFAKNQFQLNLFPVIDAGEKLLHLEAPVRLQFENNQLLNAGQFLGWAQRVERLTQLDLRSLQLAIDWLSKQNSDIGINVSAQLLSDSDAQKQFIETLSNNKSLCNRLWFEFPENGVYHYLTAFKDFCERAKKLGCHIGIEHAGHLVEKIGLLHDTGLDYLKVDSTYIHDIDSNTANQVFLQGLVSIAHAVGLKIIAEGVSKPAETATLWRLGFDGLTGPAVGLSE